MSEQLIRELTVFLKLAGAYQKKHQFPDRDRTLVLAGSCASLLDLEPFANFCRHLVLQNNRGHMIGRYSGFQAAVADDDFQVFLKQLARRFPFEKSESLLQSLNYVSPVNREEFANDLEYFCGLMSIELEWLEENFG